MFLRTWFIVHASEVMVTKISYTFQYLKKCKLLSRISDFCGDVSSRFPYPEHGEPAANEDWKREVSPVPQLRREEGNEEPVKGTKPWFIQTIPSEMSVHIGDPITLNCIIDGDPKPLGRCLQ